MPRPRQCRYVATTPSVTYFKPRGIPMTALEEVCLGVEELDALRLADLEGLTGSEAACRMRVSRHTFGRTLAAARRTVALALVTGRALRIEGGHYALAEPDQRTADAKENTMQKIAISSEGPTLDDLVDPRFGRAGGFVVVDLPDMSVSYIDNGASQTMSMGAGIETAERVANAGVQVVLSGYVGPKAFDALKAAGIKVCQDVSGTVREAVERFQKGEFPFADAPNKKRTRMRIAIASGKGGAGKTSVAASLASVWDSPLVAVDTDVEAPNLHLFLPPQVDGSSKAWLEVPSLDLAACSKCGKCREICSFKAIASFAGNISIFPDMCHGCGGCFAVCADKALKPVGRELGELDHGTVLDGTVRFLMGRTRIGESMTPPLLRQLRARLDAMLAEIPADAILDAPPGVSCPAVTVTRDVDLILLVADPTPFGFHDFRLAHQAFLPLNKAMAVVINRAGAEGNADGDAAVRDYCREHGLPLLAELPFERAAAEQYANGRLLAALSPEWKQRFEHLRDALRRLGGEVCHA